MTLRASILILAILTHCGVPCLDASVAEATHTIRLNGSVFVPEIQINKRVNPITKFLLIGSFDTKSWAEKIQNPLCEINLETNTILIKSPERLLRNSTTQVLTPSNADAFLDGISWGQRQATYIAFNVTSARRQSAVIEINTNYDASLFHNGKFACSVSASNARDSEGHGYFPVTLEAGDNLINIKQISVHGKPLVQMTVWLDHSQDMRAAWQPQNGLLSKLVYFKGEHADPVKLDWNPNLSGFSVSLEVRDVATNRIVLQKERVRRGRVTGDGDADLDLAPGIYEAIYQSEGKSDSEFFMVGNPDDLFAGLQKALSQYTPDSKSKLDIEAQLRRARILLAKGHHNIFSRDWQEKIAYTFGCLATMGRRLKEGAVNIAKDQAGLHIRGFVSGADGSFQSYRLFVPSNYNPGSPLPLLVIAPARIKSRERPFIGGPVIANHREALLWVKYAEKHGFALLWPGYRSAPEGYSYESVTINEAIQSVEKDYNIDKHRISVYATCGAGYNAGRLVTEYNNRFAAIIYDLAVFDLSLDKIKSVPSLLEWYNTVNPSRHVIGNRNIEIFVLHDGTKPSGHGPMELTTAFLNQAGKTRDDIISHLSKQPMTLAERMDMVFTWLALCRNEKTDATRSQFLARSGYTGPIMEIFSTPLLVVEGTHATGSDLAGMKFVVETLRRDYIKHFHGAECAVKKDTNVTDDDINSHSLVLVGNPQSNSVWEKLQPKLSVKVTPEAVMYGNDRLTGFQPFQAIVRHPSAGDKYVLLIGAGDLRTLGQVTTSNLFNAWYDSLLFPSRKIVGKLDSLHDIQKIPAVRQRQSGNPNIPNLKSITNH